jgi:cation:H+ antiporter
MVTWIEGHGPWAPLLFVALFIGSSLLMVWALESMNAGGLEGTVLGTLITPYCTGLGNLLVAFVVGRDHGPGSDVMTNALVNNITNMTILIGLPAVFWSMRVLPAASEGKGRKKRKRVDGNREHEVNRLSLLLTLTAVLFFTGAVWALARDGNLDFDKGLVLVGLFLFWQAFHVYDVLKTNVQKNKSLDSILLVYLAILGVGAYAQYLSIDWLEKWTEHQPGFIADNSGWFSGLLCALPNGLLAIYYGWRGNPEVVYTSQAGDGHICIPLCVGIFALYQSFTMPPDFQMGVYVLLGSTLVHMFCVAVFGELPRIVGILLVVAGCVYLGMTLRN